MPQQKADRCKVNHDIVLCRDDVLGTWEALADHRHLLRIVGLCHEVVVIELSSRLNDENDVVVEANTIGLDVGVPSIFFRNR